MESRRRIARRIAREGVEMDVSTAVSATRDDRPELLAFLDEELGRLPGRYRDPLLLCALEGVSRQDAARQLGLAEGTLSSRLSRGRSLLRDRLTRRGVAIGAGLSAGLIAKTSRAALPESLASSTVRLALSFAARGAEAGAVPAAVASLAEGVFAMISAARWKRWLLTLGTLGAATCLTAGLAWAMAPRPVPQTVEAKPQAFEPKPTSKVARTGKEPGTLSGRVMGPDGKPVAGARVWMETLDFKPVITTHTSIAEARTDGEGRFRLGPIPPLYRGRDNLLYVEAEGFPGLLVPRSTLTVFPGRDSDLGTLKLERGRVFTGRVVDENGKPRQGARVFAQSNYSEQGGSQIRGSNTDHRRRRAIPDAANARRSAFGLGLDSGIWRGLYFSKADPSGG